MYIIATTERAYVPVKMSCASSTLLKTVAVVLSCFYEMFLWNVFKKSHFDDSIQNITKTMLTKARNDLHQLVTNNPQRLKTITNSTAIQDDLQ